MIDFNALDESRCKSKTSITKLSPCLYSYFLALSISQLVSLLSSKNNSLLLGKWTWKWKNLIVKKLASEQFTRKINDADIISWRRIVNARQNIRRISVIFLASTALSQGVFSHFKRFLRLSRPRDIDFFSRTDFYKWYRSQWNREDTKWYNVNHRQPKLQLRDDHLAQ